MHLEFITTQIPRFYGAKVKRTWPLRGGVSARMAAFELELPVGEIQKVIVRSLSSYRIRQRAHAAKHEFEVLQVLRGAGLRVQEAYGYQDGPEAFLVIEYIEGQPEIAPPDVHNFLKSYARQLAAIHRIDTSLLNPDQFEPESNGYGNRPDVLDHSMREEEIRDELEAISPVKPTNPYVLRHGDFWPGNVLWRDGEIVAVIDWEECLIGDPLADLAICRLDLWWILGEDAAYRFTELYQEEMNLDLGVLPYWDLCASLRPVGGIDEWATSYPPLGRPDITPSTMRADHLAFVEQALKKLR